MDKLLSVKLTGKADTVQALRRYGPQVMTALATKTQSLTLQLQRHVVERKLSGQVLNVVTGALRRSITQVVTVNGYIITGRVFSSGDVKYAAIHEYGGVIVRYPHSRIIRLRTDRKGELLRQASLGKHGVYTDRGRAALERAAVFASTKHKLAVERRATVGQYTINMPERSYMRTSLADMRTEISTELKNAALSAAGVR